MDNAVGRQIMDLINSIPKIDADKFEEMMNANMKVIHCCQLFKPVGFWLLYMTTSRN